MEESQISINQKLEGTVIWLLIGWNSEPFPKNATL